MRVTLLHIGDTKVPFGQFYGGSNGEWLGLRAVAKFLSDKTHYIVVPIYATLVEHPDHGAILVDTGINWRQAHDHRAYYNGPLLRAAFDEDEYLLERDQQLLVQLERRGLTPSDIRTVVLTHLHEDHLGGVRDLIGAQFIVSQGDWRARNLGIFLFRRTPSLKGILTKPDIVSFASPGVHGFPASHDLFGDGSLVLLPTPGHSAGHMSVLIDTGAGRLLCVGDTLYTIRHLASDQLRPIMLGKRAQRNQLESIRLIRELRAQMPEMIIIPGHDHTEYGAELERGLQGEPEADAYQRIRDMSDGILTPDGRLREPSRAVYRASATGVVGDVVFE